MAMSVRLDNGTERLVNRLAKARGQTKSDVVRDAIRVLAREEKPLQEHKTLYERIEHLIGCADSGGANLSEKTGEKFARLLQERARGRRSR